MSVTETDVLRLSRGIKDLEDLPGMSGEMSMAEVGAIALWPMSAPPQSWLLCDGSEVSRAVYSALFNRIGTTFGAGNGTTTFNLPNYSGISGSSTAANQSTGGGGAHNNTQPSITVYMWKRTA